MPKFDLAQTQVLAELFETPKDKREEEWRRRFYAAVPDATLMSFDPQVNQGPDKFPYFHMAIPDPGPVTHILDVVLDEGLGIAIFGDSSRSDDPQWVFTYGDLLSYSLYGSFDGDPAFIGSDGGGQAAAPVLVASPSEAYLPARARKAMGKYARAIFKLPDPKIALVDGPPSGGARSLMINLTLDEYDGDERLLNAALHYLTWFLPRTYRIAAMPPGWSDSGWTSM